MSLFAREDGRALAVVRYREAGDLRAVISAIRRGGIPLVEVTSDSPGALEAVVAAAEQGTPIGAGTILDGATAVSFAEAGASFLVSPGVVPEMIAVARDHAIPAVAGALTPTEIGSAVGAGASHVKLFPASLGGPGYLRSLRGPFPDVAFVPTGGIAIEQIAAWLEAGAAGVGLGGALVGDEPPATPDALDALEERAARVAALARR